MPNVEPQLSAVNYPPKLLKDMINNGMHFWLSLPITFATADAAQLYKVPSSYRMLIHRAAWDFGVAGAASWTGGVSSAIGISSDDANASTKGDILGGAAGDVAATLVSTGVPIKGGTIGAKFGSNGLIVLAAGKILRFDRIASAFAAGSCSVLIEASFVPLS